MTTVNLGREIFTGLPSQLRVLSVATIVATQFGKFSEFLADEKCAQR